MEKWRDMPYNYFGDRYMISSFGRIKRKARQGSERYINEEILKTRLHKKSKLMFLDLYSEDESGKPIRKTVYVHKAVADAFLPKPSNNEIEYKATHIGSNLDNQLSNIKWTTQSEISKETMRKAPKEVRNRIGEHQRAKAEERKKIRASEEDDVIVFSKETFNNSKPTLKIELPIGRFIFNKKSVDKLKLTEKDKVQFVLNKKEKSIKIIPSKNGFVLHKKTESTNSFALRFTCKELGIALSKHIDLKHKTCLELRNEKFIIK